MLEKVNQVNWRFCGGGFARVGVWFDSGKAALLSLHPSLCACSDQMQLSSGFVPLPDFPCSANWGSQRCIFLMAAS